MYVSFFYIFIYIQIQAATTYNSHVIIMCAKSGTIKALLLQQVGRRASTTLFYIYCLTYIFLQL